MTENNKNIERLESLFLEIKKYVELHTDLVKLDFTEKFSIIMSKLILLVVCAVLGLLILLNCSFMLVYILNDYLHDLVLSYGIIGMGFLLVFAVIYWKREEFITRPVVNFLGKLFLDKNDKKEP